MKRPIVPIEELERDMRAVARGEKEPPSYAGADTFNSANALIRLLIPENRRLLMIIRDHEPQSIAELAKLTDRAASNVTRTLAKLEAIGLIRMDTAARRKVPVTLVRKLTIEIDPFGSRDQVIFG